MKISPQLLGYLSSPVWGKLLWQLYEINTQKPSPVPETMQVISLPSMTTYKVHSVERTPMAGEKKVRKRLYPHPKN